VISEAKIKNYLLPERIKKNNHAPLKPAAAFTGFPKSPGIFVYKI
jgi:hypothetical protein